MAFEYLKKVLNAYPDNLDSVDDDLKRGTRPAPQMQSLTLNDIREARKELEQAQWAIDILKKIGESILEEKEAKK